MKIAIFGGNGFIGRALQEKAKGVHEVVIFDLPEVNVQQPETFAGWLQALRPDAVINLAGILGGVKESPSILDLFAVNVMGNIKVLEAAQAASVKNYIFASSMTVHGENKIGEHQRRFSLFNPKHGYGASKAAAEYSLQQFLREAPEMRIAAVRPTMVLDSNANLPHAPIEFIKTILSGKDIEIYGEGRHEREWIWIDDAAEGIWKAVEYVAAADPGYYPFFLSAARISMRDLAEKIASKLGGKVVFTPSTKQAFTLTSDLEESQVALRWHPQIGMDTMIDRLIEGLKDKK